MGKDITPRDEILKIMEICTRPSSMTSCPESCPRYEFAKAFDSTRCMATLIEKAIPFVHDTTPDLLGPIMSHYKKPFVTININISEDET